ncbi:hypothetical protein [Mucilaginibacter sp. HD30]
MKKRPVLNFSFLNILCLFVSLNSFAQQNIKKGTSMTLLEVQKKYDLDPSRPLLKRISRTPDKVIKMFQDAGMLPTEHQLTNEEEIIVASEISALPPLHQRVLKQHLKSISFLDNMPNTALTSTITTDGSVNLYHITFRAGILHQNITEWVNEKEATCFSGGDSTLLVSIQAGKLEALTYVLLHEGTHVVDGSMHLISADSEAGKPHMNDFTRKFSNGIWSNINTLQWPVKDSLVFKSRFRRGGRQFLNIEASQVYAELVKTPFVSIYSTASWHEDLAELLTVYHLTKVYKQPFRITIKRSGTVVEEYKPMSSTFVKHRLELLRRFYL